MELADELISAINEWRTRLNQIAQQSPGRAIQVELHWHPRMQKCDAVVRVVDHLPSWQSKASEGEALSA